MSASRSFRYVAIAAGMSVLAVFPFAALAALLYRFPIPFGGYASGAGAVLPSIQAVAFYGVMTGGFVILAVLGGVGAWLTRFLPNTDVSRVRFRWSVAIGAGVAFVAVVLLAVLDKLIGPW